MKGRRSGHSRLFDMMLPFVGFVLTAVQHPSCVFKVTSEQEVISFDLGPIASQQDLKFQGGSNPFSALFEGGSETQSSVAISVCGNERAANPGDVTCKGEHAPGVIVEQDVAATHPFANDPIFASLFGVQDRSQAPSSPPRCAILGRRPAAGPLFALLDPAAPDQGLQLRYDKGDICREGQRFSLLVLLHCDLAAHASGSRSIPAQVQVRSRCEWVVSISTSAACPINLGERCAPNCPRTWIGDGECDAGCDTSACEHDGGDCSGRGGPSGRLNDTRECAPGCASSWLGDKECDEECNTAACGFDGGDCNGVCAPGCAEAWRHDGVCDDECNTGSCDYDSGDCLKPGGRPFARERWAWGCPSSWLADGQCDIACNVTRCGYDKGDCISGWKHRPAYGQRWRGDGMGRGGRLPQSDADAEVRERAKDARAPLRAPQAALLEARTDLPGLGLSVRASADVSQISVRAFAGLAGALALLLCCVGVLCAALCWAVLARRARYESYRVINPARPL